MKKLLSCLVLIFFPSNAQAEHEGIFIETPVCVCVGECLELPILSASGGLVGYLYRDHKNDHYWQSDELFRSWVFIHKWAFKGDSVFYEALLKNETYEPLTTWRYWLKKAQKA